MHQFDSPAVLMYAAAFLAAEVPLLMLLVLQVSLVAALYMIRVAVAAVRVFRR